MWPRLIWAALAVRPPQRKRKRKNTTRSAEQHMHGSISAKQRAPPFAGSRVTRRLHKQTPAVVSVPLKIPQGQSLDVFSAWPDSDRPEHNDIFRDGSAALQKAMPLTDVSVRNYRHQDRLSERQPLNSAGRCRAKALGNIRFCQLSLPHLRYLNI